MKLELPPRGNQTAFNLRCWEVVLSDPDLRKMEGRVETDRHGRAVVNQLEAPLHGQICIEVASPRNSEEEVREKMELYFDAGAEEVWICGSLGEMSFYGRGGKALPRSEICPEFPKSID